MNFAGSLAQVSRLLVHVPMLLVLLWTGPAVAAVPHTAPTGDLNQDGAVDVVDIQCEVLMFTSVVYNQACALDEDCVAAFGDSYICQDFRRVSDRYGVEGAASSSVVPGRAVDPAVGLDQEAERNVSKGDRQIVENMINWGHENVRRFCAPGTEASADLDETSRGVPAVSFC